MNPWFSAARYVITWAGSPVRSCPSTLPIVCAWPVASCRCSNNRPWRPCSRPPRAGPGRSTVCPLRLHQHRLQQRQKRLFRAYPSRSRGDRTTSTRTSRSINHDTNRIACRIRYLEVRFQHFTRRILDFIHRGARRAKLTTQVAYRSLLLVVG
jgi:hypothetical protein